MELQGPPRSSAGTISGLTSVSWGLNKHKISLGQRRDLDVGSGVVSRGMNKRRIQLGSVKGHRGALRSAEGI